MGHVNDQFERWVWVKLLGYQCDILSAKKCHSGYLNHSCQGLQFFLDPFSGNVSDVESLIKKSEVQPNQIDEDDEGFPYYFF